MLTNKNIRKKPDRLRQIPRAAIPRQQQFHQNQHHPTRRFVRVPITFPIAIIPLYLPNHVYLSNPLKTATTAPSETQQSTLAYQEAQTHMTALIKTEEKSAIQSQQTTTTTTTTTPAEFYKMANLVLFLAGGMSENLSGKIFDLDGSCREL